MLRLADDDRAIVFCRTRDNVAELHADLFARGFLAAAISGDRAQEERTRALEALRDGHVRVLVATNVAARGLDLPDVGLVVHADLPENAEALTHRSGRTGRAGNKGVNLFLVERGARRRAERLFHEAHLKLAWTRAARRRRRRRARSRAPGRAKCPRESAPRAIADVTTMAEKLLADHDAVAVVALLRRAHARRRGPRARSSRASSCTRRRAASSGSRGPARAAGKGAPSFSEDMVPFEVNLGAKDRAEANWILPLVCRRGGITRREVGAIRVARDRTYFEVARRVAEEFAANAPSAIRARRTCASRRQAARCRRARSRRRRAARARTTDVRTTAPTSVRTTRATSVRTTRATNVRTTAPTDGCTTNARSTSARTTSGRTTSARPASRTRPASRAPARRTADPRRYCGGTLNWSCTLPVA